MAQENTGDTMKFEVESRLDDLFGEAIGTEDSGAGVNDSFAFDESETDDILKPEAIEFHEEGVEMENDHPLEELKSTVLSIDWEITDEVMTRFVNQVEDLKTTFKDNKISLLFLQLLGSVGVYIRTNQGKADPDAFKVLGSAFKSFDDVVSSSTMAPAEQKKILSVQLDKFKELKKKIASKKPAAKPGVTPPVKAAVNPTVPNKPTVNQKQPAAKKTPPPVFVEDSIALIVESSDDNSGGDSDVKEIVLSPIEGINESQRQDIISEVLVEMKKFIRGEFDDLREELRLRKKRR